MSAHELTGSLPICTMPSWKDISPNWLLLFFIESLITKTKYINSLQCQNIFAFQSNFRQTRVQEIKLVKNNFLLSNTYLQPNNTSLCLLYFIFFTEVFSHGDELECRVVRGDVNDIYTDTKIIKIGDSILEGSAKGGGNPVGQLNYTSNHF